MIYLTLVFNAIEPKKVIYLIVQQIQISYSINFAFLGRQNPVHSSVS